MSECLIGMIAGVVMMSPFAIRVFVSDIQSLREMYRDAKWAREHPLGGHYEAVFRSVSSAYDPEGE